MKKIILLIQLGFIVGSLIGYVIGCDISLIVINYISLTTGSLIGVVGVEYYKE